MGGEELSTLDDRYDGLELLNFDGIYLSFRLHTVPKTKSMSLI
ncbi:hypothetical protein CEV31_2761 [Brucella thiophenivorans]|uniref:Uncharacterized protein n=1 Tax=Brucella thiophenivorans TaxID=571255 RepID=A0A256FLC7_9HYPH|nr:hypothetical protein CEV31_2761 [Brucella thiophenivorans]